MIAAFSLRDTLLERRRLVQKCLGFFPRGLLCCFWATRRADFGFFLAPHNSHAFFLTIIQFLGNHLTVRVWRVVWRQRARRTIPRTISPGIMWSALEHARVRPDARIFCHTHHHTKQQSHHQNHPGPIWNCPAGHLLCNVCYNTESGASEPCYTCKIPMGSTTSLVAKNSDQLFNKIFGSLGQGLHVSFGDVCMLLCPSPSLQPMKSNIHT